MPVVKPKMGEKARLKGYSYYSYYDAVEVEE